MFVVIVARTIYMNAFSGKWLHNCSFNCVTVKCSSVESGEMIKVEVTNFVI